MVSELSTVKNELDSLYSRMQDPAQWGTALLQLALMLNHLRQTVPPDLWQEIVHICLEHPLAGIVYQDPLTERTFAKPRGYAGDAVMIDLLYGHTDTMPLVQSATPIGQKLLETIRTWPSALGVQERCHVITRAIDSLASTVQRPDILAVACGHLRELDSSEAFAEDRMGRFVGLDQDAESLAVVAARYPIVERINEGVEAMFYPDFDIGCFDLVYATGLYDYLSQKTAQQLTQRLFDQLKPQGMLLIANLRKGLPDVGYMESYMDWKLIYRAYEDMADLCTTISVERIGKKNVYLEKHESVFFIELTRK